MSRTLYGSCPLCSSKSMAVERENVSCTGHALWSNALPTTMTWMRCGQCGHVFTDGYFDDPLPAQESQTPGHNIERGRIVAAEMIEWVMSVTGMDSGRWFDVGVGAGHLLTTAEEYGFDVCGCDSKAETVDALSACGYRVTRGEFGSGRCPESGFDIVSLADVLEHIPFPADAAREAAGVLKNLGALFVSMPNTDSFVWRALDAAGKNPFWSELEHYHNFSRASLTDFLGKFGFTPIGYRASRRYRACMEMLFALEK